MTPENAKDFGLIDKVVEKGYNSLHIVATATYT